MRTLLLTAAFLFLSNHLLAEELFKSEPAKKAVADYHKRLGEAETQYIADLEKASKEAAKNEDANEILLIQNALNILKKADRFDPRGTKAVVMKHGTWGANSSDYRHEFRRDGTLISTHVPSGQLHQTGGWKELPDGTLHAYWNRNIKGKMPLNEMKLTAHKDGKTLEVIGCDHGKDKLIWLAQWQPK